MEAMESVKERIHAKVRGVLEAPSLPRMLDIVHTIDDFVVTSASVAGVKIEGFSVVRSITVQNAFPILFAATSDGIEVYFQYVRSTIEQCRLGQTQLVNAVTHWPGPEQLAFACHHSEIDSFKLLECAQLYRLAQFSFESEGIISNEGRQVLRKLMATLNISFDDLGRMFNVAGETVRRWERGANPIPSDKNANILSTQAPLDKLLQIFQPDTLHIVIRRANDLFQGERALDWILRGRIGDVANRYEMAFRYQA